MAPLWIIAAHELRTRLHSGSHWFLVVVAPALIIYLVGLGTLAIAASVPGALRVDVLDQDQSAASGAFVATLAAGDTALIVCPRAPDPADTCALNLAGRPGAEPMALTPELAGQRLAAEVSAAMLTIPPGFGAALADTAGRAEAPRLVFRPGASPAAAATAFSAVRRAANRVSGPLIAARLSTEFAKQLGIEAGPAFYAERRADAEAAWTSPQVRVETATARPNWGRIMAAQLLDNGFKLSTPSIAAMFVMLSILGLTQTLAEERVTGILGRLAALPVRKAEILGGKLLATVMLGLGQCSVLLVFGAALGGAPGVAPWMAAAIFVVAAAYVLAVAALALALLALTDSPAQASALATLTWVVLVPLGGGWWPLAYVPGWMQIVGHLSPVAWFLDAVNAVIFFGGGWADIWRSTAALLLFALVGFALGIRLFGLAARPGDRRPGWNLINRREDASAPLLPYFGDRE